jgi:nucleoside-diphosphate kinase
MMERTLIIIKPDGMQRHLIGFILTRFEQKGIQLVAAKLMRISESLARRHYAVHEGKPFFEGVVRYLSSSPSLVMVWQGPGAIQIARKLMGPTFGCDAEPGTIRGDFGCSRGYNLIHGSDSPESAKYEIELYFKPEEIVKYDFSDAAWLYGSNE